MEIILPRNAEQPVYRCLTCNAGFYKDQQRTWQQHVGACARFYMDDIQKMRPSVRHEGTMWASFDPELEAHFKKVGENMKREGRLEIKPHETGGN